MVKTILFIFGEDLWENPPFVHYIQRHINAAHGPISEQYNLSETDPAVVELVERLLQSPAFVFVVASPSAARLFGRIVCDVLQSNALFEHDLWIPESATHRSDRGFVHQTEHAHLQLMVTNSGQALPAVDLSTLAKPMTLHLIDRPLDELITTIETIASHYQLSYHLSEIVSGWTLLRLYPKNKGLADAAAAAIQTAFADNVIIAESMARHLIMSLQRHDQHITFAESCTGGQLSSFLTAQSGSSNVFDGALITYANRIKEQWVDVDTALLQAHGAVSAEVVEAMSLGALNRSDADYAIAVSGIAGPDGGSVEKPVGTVYVNVRSKQSTTTTRLQLLGDRNYVQEQTVFHAIKMLITLAPEIFFDKSATSQK